MNVIIFAAGKPALSFAKTAIAEYLKRLSRFQSVQVEFIKAGTSEEVSALLLKKSEGMFRVALDERGASWTTQQFYQQFLTWEQRGDLKTIAFLIGASDGHTEELRRQSQQLLSLSAMTLQHEFALILLLEQIYRLQTIKSGSPYHRE